MESYPDRTAYQREWAKKWRNAHLEQAREQGRRSYWLHRDKRLEGNRRYYRTHTEEMRLRRKKYWETHRDYYREQGRKWGAEHRIIRWAYGTISKHKRKGYIVKLTAKQLENVALNTPRCSICGIKLAYFNNNGKPLPNSPALDRRDNEKEIRLDNIQITCLQCGSTKRNRTMKGFVEYCEMVYRKFSELKQSDGLQKM